MTTNIRFLFHSKARRFVSFFFFFFNLQLDFTRDFYVWKIRKKGTSPLKNRRDTSQDEEGK